MADSCFTVKTRYLAIDLTPAAIDYVASLSRASSSLTSPWAMPPTTVPPFNGDDDFTRGALFAGSLALAADNLPDILRRGGGVRVKEGGQCNLGNHRCAWPTLYAVERWLFWADIGSVMSGEEATTRAGLLLAGACSSPVIHGINRSVTGMRRFSGAVLSRPARHLPAARGERPRADRLFQCADGERWL